MGFHHYLDYYLVIENNISIFLFKTEGHLK